MADEKVTKQGLEMADQELDTVVGGAKATVKHTVDEYYYDPKTGVHVGDGPSSTATYDTAKFTPAAVKKQQQKFLALSDEEKAAYRINKSYFFEPGWPLYGF